MYLGRLPVNSFKKVDWDKLFEEAQDNLNHLGLKFSSQRPSEESFCCRSADDRNRQMPFIGARFIIMDEPTAALAEEEIKILFGIIEELKKKGIAIIYISHRMDEIFKISDRLTVFRDGRYWLPDKLMRQIMMMWYPWVGRNVSNLYPVRNYKAQEVVLEAKEINSRNVHDMNLKLHKGEILGITGLLGSGTIELSKLLYGAIPWSGRSLRSWSEKRLLSTCKSAESGDRFCI